MFGAFGGILMVGLSKRLTEKEELAPEEGTASITNTDNYQLGLIFAVGTMLGQSVTLVVTRRLKMLSVIVIQWYYAVASCIITGLCILFF